MVYRHAEAPFSKFVLSFHMALFFIASGYLYNELRINSAGDYYKYVVRKIKSLWIPYVLFNGCFIALQNLFIRFNVYTNTPEFLIEYPGRYATLTMPLNFVEVIKELVKILLFQGGTQLGGALWFLQSLFYISCGYALINYMLKRINRQSAEYIHLVISIVFLIVEIGRASCRERV